MKVFFLTALCALATSLGVAASQTTLNSINVPEVTLNGQNVPYILLTSICFKEASFWEQLNNGLDSWSMCREFIQKPDDNAANGLVIENFGSGGYQTPKIKLTDNGYGSDAHIVCLEVSPVVQLKDLFGNVLPYALTRTTRERIIFCNTTQIPDFAPPGYSNLEVFSFEQFEEVLSQPLSFSSSN